VSSKTHFVGQTEWGGLASSNDKDDRAVVVDDRASGKMMNNRRQLLATTSLAHVMVVGAFIANDVVVRLRFAERSDRRNNLRHVPLRSSDYESSDQSIDNILSSTSIGDITQNLHGGKYQFSETQYLAGGSLMGQQFAESLYSSCNDASFEEDDEVPKWALKIRHPDKHEGKQLNGVLAFNDCAKSHTISIKNDERSWEQYFVYVLSSNVQEQPFQISPLRGHLAPRGGASNACDASKPYLDSADITVELIGNGRPLGRTLLVAGTEAEIWRYELKIE
jgi:hypothetical protein